jgi:DNA polymerase-3 subunit alpha
MNQHANPETFIHLAVHSAYSLSEGAIHIADLVKQCQGFKMPAVAVTDTNNLFGALEFSVKMRSEGVQPIIGVTISLTNPYIDTSRGGRPLDAPKIRLYVQNKNGYQNLLKLVSRAHLQGQDMESPQVSFDDLKELGGDLIMLTGGSDGPITQLLSLGQDDDAKAFLRQFQDLFDDRLYIELTRHGLALEVDHEEDLLDFAYDMNIPIVATNDVYFSKPDMYAAHDALLCIAAGAYVAEDNRKKVTKEHRFKETSEMLELFKDLPEALENTLIIAKRCGYATEIIDPILPNFADDVDGDITEADMLRKDVEKGLEGRLKTHVFLDGDDEATRAEKAKIYYDRMKVELGVIENMGFPGYFLIVADFIKWAKEHDIPVGPGRGSGAGSIVAWALLITDLDPLRFGLLFERFLNPERVSMPDFDIDFCQDKRDQVIKYVQDKYGHDQVAQIITFGKLQARAALRDVARVMQMSYPQADRLSKLIPGDATSPVSLAEALKQEPKLEQERQNDELTAAVIDRALKIEGLLRHASTHAAGVVIGDRPLDELVPLYRDPKSDMPVTQFNMKWVEQAGLVKFDFLGLKTLTVIKKAVEFIADRGIEVDIETLPLDNARTFEMLSAGDAAGVFQLESVGMRQVLKGMKPDTFEDIIAIVALYRPGPMENIPTYVNRKHGLEDPDYMHPKLEGILKETYGVIIYQEQVMQIAQELAGYSLGGADLLRRAMGKKIKAEMDAQRGVFLAGAIKEGVDKAQANEIFDKVAKFADYGFNKSHAAAYALVAYQTAYLKANYPVEFMAAIMDLDQHNTDKLGLFKKELISANIPILLPDINKSNAGFKVEMTDGGLAPSIDDPKGGLGVRYALGAIKNVGEKAMESIVGEREANGPFKDLFDFAERIDTRQINKRSLEQLSAAGAFDHIAENRAQAHAATEMILRHAQDAQRQRESDQTSLFGGADDDVVAKPTLPDVDMWAQGELLQMEKTAIGFYLSSHPLEIYTQALARQKVVEIPEALSNPLYHNAPQKYDHKKRNPGKIVRVAGSIDGYSERRSQKSGKQFAFLSLSDLVGSLECLVFSDMLETARALVEAGGPIIAGLKLEKRQDDDSLFINLVSAEPLDKITAKDAMNLDIYIREGLPANIKEGQDHPIQGLARLLEDHKGGGQSKVTLYVPFGDGQNEAIIELAGSYKVTPELKQAVIGGRCVSDAKEI